MFQFKVEEETELFVVERLPLFLNGVDEAVLLPWRKDGYRTSFGEVELNSETADRAFYFDVRRGAVHLRLVVGIKETGESITVTCNVVRYSKDTKYVVLAAVVAGVITGSFFYQYVISPLAFTALETAVAWVVSAVAATAFNYLIIRYLLAQAKKRFSAGGRARIEAGAIEVGTRRLAVEMFSKYGRFF